MVEGQEILDRYIILEQAGAGGMATVWHARDKVLGRDVAIKCIELSAEDARRASRATAGALRGKHAAAPAGSGGVAGAQAVEAPNSSPQAGSSSVNSQQNAQVAEGVTFSNAEVASAGAPAGEAAAHSQFNTIFEPLEQTKVFPADPAFLDKRAEYIAWQKAISHASASTSIDDIPPWEDAPVASDAADVQVAEAASDLPAAVDGVAGAADAQVTPSAYRTPALFSAAPLGFASGTAERREFTPTDPSEPSTPPFEEGAADMADAGEAENASSDANSVLDEITGVSEARSVARLNDANIVTVYDCVVEGAFAYVIMEFVEGKTLAQVTRELENNITLDMIAAVFGAVAHALEVAHDEGLLHLDIKPENVIINAKGQVKVTDFGLATLMDASGKGSAGGGTIGYMPPEQIKQEKLDVRTDEWALASLLYEMLSGAQPFRAKSLPAALVAIESAELVVPSQCWAEIDAAIDDAVFMALDPDPAERFASVRAFSQAVTPCLGNVKAGQKQLAAAVVRGPEAAVEEAAPDLPRVPFIDALGPGGADAVMRVFAVLGCVSAAAVALLNVRLDVANAWGVFSWCAPAAWVALAVVGVGAALRPRWAVLAPVVLMAVALGFNHAWVALALVALAGGAWWYFSARHSNTAATLACLQPLFGAVGAGAIVPAVAGAMLDVAEAAATAAAAVAWSFVLGMFGSAELFTWDATAHVILPASASIAADQLNATAINMLLNPQIYIVSTSWVAAAAVYALFCRKGTRAFDVLGACVAAALLLACAICAPVIFAGAINWPQTLMATLACAIGITFAIIHIPDRVRMEEGEW